MTNEILKSTDHLIEKRKVNVEDPPDYLKLHSGFIANDCNKYSVHEYTMLLEGQNDKEDKNLISDGCSTPSISASYLVFQAAPSNQ